MRLAEHDQVVETFATYRSDESFDVASRAAHGRTATVDRSTASGAGDDTGWIGMYIQRSAQGQCDRGRLAMSARRDRSGIWRAAATIRR